MRKKTQFATILGFMIGISCISISIMGAGSFSSFLNWPSVFITIGGTVGAVVVAFPPDKLKLLGPVMKRSFKKDEYNLIADIDTLVDLSTIARTKGLLALEDVANTYDDDPFLQKGLMLVVDGYEGETLRSSMESDIYFSRKRHQDGHMILDLIASTTPALGLLGTYIGLIPMLEHLDDPTSLGPLMAVELVTSFYGAFVAYVVFGPMSKKLKIMDAAETFRKEIILEGLIAIHEGQHPRVIKSRLETCLTYKQLHKMNNAAMQPQRQGA